MVAAFDMTIDVKTETSGGSRHTIQIDAHTLHTDLALAATAPGPHDYFDAALAACKALTAVTYARHKKFALDKIHVHIERDDSKEKEGTYVLKLNIEYEGALTAAEKQRVHEVLTKCPVHKLMTTTEIDIQTAPLPA